MKVIALVQARGGSTRLPNKVMKTIRGQPMIGLLLQRLSLSQTLDGVVVATSEAQSSDELFDYVTSIGFACYRGSEGDVLDRFHKAAAYHSADVVVRITGDCPLVDAELVDDCVSTLITLDADYLSNVHPPTFPDGLDVEVFRFSALEKANRDAQSLHDREHVTPYIVDNKEFNKQSLSCEHNLADKRWTVDEEEDFSVISNIFEHFLPRIDFTWKEVLAMETRFPNLFEENKAIRRNEGSSMGAGQKLWKRAKRIIPGGNMLLSKRAELMLPDHWPAYFEKAKGCKVWDLDGREFFDVGLMGVGTNILGYGDSDVDGAVKKTVDKGNMSSLNCPEEVHLAEKLIAMHPWSGGVRLARTGGEANAIAIRIARAYSGREGVAVCGYHGWHDWYLAANLTGDDNLDVHLIPGLEPKGVPSSLKGTIHPFNYNDIDVLKDIVSRHNIGVIKMEVMRNEEPENDFLNEVSCLAKKNGIVLVFDECTSGFRETFGGLHLKYGVTPDIAVFGKALGNGYAITAILGKSSVMAAAQASFISSTFWTERIGPTAALKALEVMEASRSWEFVTSIGNAVTRRWAELADAHGVDIKITGLPAIAGFTFQSEHANLYKTFLTQEMLKKGFLATSSFYACTAHTPGILEKYFAGLDEVFWELSRCEKGRDIRNLLEGPISHDGFQRLN